MPIQLSERMRLILALLRVYGPQRAAEMIQIFYPGQRVFLGRQEQYFMRTLETLKEAGLIEDFMIGPTLQWKITEKGKNLQ